MNIKVAVIGLWALLLVGCQDAPEISAPEEDAPATNVPAESGEQEPLRALESLTRVRLDLLFGEQPFPKGEPFHAEVLETLRQHLPQVSADGSADDWRVEVKVLFPDRRTEPGIVGQPVVRDTYAWQVRVLKEAVVDGRIVTAVAYDARAGETPYDSPPGNWGFKDPRWLAQDKAIARLAEAWRQDNPEADGTTRLPQTNR